MLTLGLHSRVVPTLGSGVCLWTPVRARPQALSCAFWFGTPRSQRRCGTERSVPCRRRHVFDLDRVSARKSRQGTHRGRRRTGAGRSAGHLQPLREWPLASPQSLHSRRSLSGSEMPLHRTYPLTCAQHRSSRGERPVMSPGRARSSCCPVCNDAWRSCACAQASPSTAQAHWGPDFTLTGSCFGFGRPFKVAFSCSSISNATSFASSIAPCTAASSARLVAEPGVG
mmetsp:Transcript_69182/g.214588  ORF Transcript_69182/g.214588 Transcript_69182/m.214588 type:complete len:227 (+) Transcript_69182:3-683(+)